MKSPKINFKNIIKTADMTDGPLTDPPTEVLYDIQHIFPPNRTDDAVW